MFTVRSALRTLALVAVSVALTREAEAQRPTFERLGRKLVGSQTATCVPRDVTNNWSGTFGGEQVIYEPYVVGGTVGSLSGTYRKCRWRDFDDDFVVQDDQNSAHFAIADDARYRVGVVETNPQQAQYDVYLESATQQLVSDWVPESWAPNPDFNFAASFQPGLGVSKDGSVVVGQSFPFSNSAILSQGFWLSRPQASKPVITNLDMFAFAVSADGNVAVGEYRESDVTHSVPAIWYQEQSQLVQLESLLGWHSRARDVSRDGSVVVGVSVTNPESDDLAFEAFRWKDGTLEGLGYLTEQFSSAFAVSGDGNRVVGGSRKSTAGRWEAFLWTPEDGMRALHSVLEEDYELDLAGWELWIATAISDDGMAIAGVGLNPDGDLEGWMAFLPRRFGRILAPDVETVLTAGESVVIEFTSWDLESGALSYSADEPFDPDDYTAMTIGATGADSLSSVVWMVPDTATTSLRIILEDFETDETLDIAGPYVVERPPPPGPPEISISWPDDAVAHDSVFVIEWEVTQGEPRITSVDIEYTVDPAFDPDDLNGPEYVSFPIASGIPIPFEIEEFADTLSWVVPHEYSDAAYLIIRDTNRPDEYFDVSSDFTIAGYHLRRVDSNGDVELFYPTQHGWSFGNVESQLFPDEWWLLEPEFMYQGGLDPFTQAPYPIEFGIDTDARQYVFPDWPSIVQSHGLAVSYFPEEAPTLYWPSFKAYWRSVHRGGRWEGSCAGMAVTALGTFVTAYEEDPDDRMGSYYESIGEAASVRPIMMSPQVRIDINEIMPRFVSKPHRAWSEWGHTKTPRLTLEEIKHMLFRTEPDEGHAYLYLAQVDTLLFGSSAGAHAIVPYKLEKQPGGVWRVYVYDPNWPGRDDIYLLIDEEEDSWTYPFITGIWGGKDRLYLMDDVGNYLDGATPQWLNEQTLTVHTDPDNDALIVSPLGDRLGKVNGVDVAEITDDFNSMEPGTIRMPVGGATEAIGYWVPVDAYTILLSNPVDSMISATLFQYDLIVEYTRIGADSSSLDRLEFDNGEVEVANDSETDFQFLLRTILTDIVDAQGKHPADVSEYVATVENVTAAAGESIRVNMTTDGRLHVDNLGSIGTSYTLDLQRASTSGLTQFRASQVMMAAGARHLVAPNWLSLDADTLTLHVDSDGDGTTDQSITLDNEADNSTATEDTGDVLPSTLVVAPNFPNPFSDRTTIRFAVPEHQNVLVRVFDSVGRVTHTLVDGQLRAGWHEVSLDGSRLANGAYFVQVRAGAATATRPLIHAGPTRR